MSTISCDKSCGPSDFCEGGKCDLNGCYTPISTELHNIITARSKIEYPAKKNQGPFTTYQQWARKGFAKCAHWLLNDKTVLKLAGFISIGEHENLIQMSIQCDPRLEENEIRLESVWIKYITEWKPGETNSGLGQALEDKFQSLI